MTTIYGDGFDRVPELPEPVAWRYRALPLPDEPWQATTHKCNSENAGTLESLFTASQMRSFYAAGVAAGMEKAAVIAEEHNDPERADDKWEKGYNHASKRIAASIRAAIRSQEG